jgi:succinate dehydrogenase/fumarate reductase flavoprotein subunit
MASSGTMVLNLMAYKAEAADRSIPKAWDETYDVMVIGSGFAGFDAAIEVQNAGAEVVIIEKMPLQGGNSIINGGDFGAAGTKLQQENSVNDSTELMLQDMLKAGAYLNHIELVKTVAYQSKDALEWCETYVGAKFTRLNYHGGHSVKRAHQTDKSSGSGLLNKMRSKSKELGIKLKTRTKMVRFISDKDDRIIGIEVRNNYTFPNEDSEKPAFIRAERPLF